MTRLARTALPFMLLALLGACSSWVDSTRASIHHWCENTPDYCDVNAVQP
jgi:hypothetical protein